ncbi:hypothetical protein MASR2M74_25110 [Paracoccaceae bacterium]
MKLAFAILLMTTALGAGSASFAAGQGPWLPPGTSLFRQAAPGAALTLIDDNEDESGGWLWSGSDDDEDDDCEEDDDEGEDVCAAGAAGNAAKAGTVAPPKNGLFTDGTAPVVKSN